MKQIFTHVLIFSIAIIFSCKDKSTNPPDNYPPGYQHDIPWPSLADSPWPMLHHDPQSTGRSNLVGPLAGTVEWVFIQPWKQIISSIAIGLDSTIYAPYENAGLIAIRPDGTIKWQILTEISSSFVTPIITSEGTIIHFAKAGVIAVNPDGSQKWTYTLPGMSCTGANIGMDGTVFFISNKTLYALGTNGQLKWSYYDTDFEGMTALSFSPDGNTLYIPGNINTPALVAFDVITKTIKWRFGSGSTQWSLVDYDGNVYVPASIDSVNEGRGTFFSLTPNGQIRWYKEHKSWSIISGKVTSWLACPTIDKFGNIFFVSDSIYSIDYSGKVRWSKKFEIDGFVTTPLVSDRNGNIFVIKEGYEKFELTVFNNDGTVLYSILNLEQYPGQSPAISIDRLYIPSGKGEIIHSIR